MEMNTRIQVEHPVTEMTTGLDLVAWQIRIAAGARLTLTERDREPRGHAIECRITAEDATNDFAPSVGTVETYVAPGGPGVRVDSHLYAGYSVPPYYDSLLGKIIAWGRDRDEAAARMERALTETVITGVPQTVSFLRSIVADDQFRAATYDTGFVSRVVARQQVMSRARAPMMTSRSGRGLISGPRSQAHVSDDEIRGAAVTTEEEHVVTRTATAWGAKSANPRPKSRRAAIRGECLPCRCSTKSI